MVRSLPFLVFFFMLALPVAMVAVTVWVAIRTRVRANLVAATPTSNVGFATDGYAEFEGQAQPVNGRMIKTPLTGAECLWYRAKLEQFRRTAGSENPTWITIRDVTSREPFLLKDGTGMCIVFPAGAEVTFTDRSVWFGPGPIPEDKNPPKKGPGESPEGNVTFYGTSDKEYRYTEERIYAGDPLYALGQFSTAPWAVEDDEDEGGADEADTEDELVEDDDDGPGTGNDWDPFEREDELIQQATAMTSRRIERPTSRPYLLSTTPQAKLLDVHNKGWKGALGVAIVPAAIAVVLLWLRFG
jgi:hypothetical protein